MNHSFYNLHAITNSGGALAGRLKKNLFNLAAQGPTVKGYQIIKATNCILYTGCSKAFMVYMKL